MGKDTYTRLIGVVLKLLVVKGHTIGLDPLKPLVGERFDFPY
jgi:hypothetical protein